MPTPPSPASLPLLASCLRPLGESDQPLYLALYGDPGTMRHIATPQGEEAMRRGFRAALHLNAAQPLRRGTWVIVDAGGGTALGLAGLVLDETGGAEVGIVLPAPHQGHGHATRAIAALADHAFGTLGLARLHTRHDAGHAPAAALMQALGFECTATTPGEKGWRWQLTPGRWAHWPRRQAGADRLRSAGLIDHHRRDHD